MIDRRHLQQRDVNWFSIALIVSTHFDEDTKQNGGLKRREELLPELHRQFNDLVEDSPNYNRADSQLQDTSSDLLPATSLRLLLFNGRSCSHWHSSTNPFHSFAWETVNFLGKILSIIFSLSSSRTFDADDDDGCRWTCVDWQRCELKDVAKKDIGWIEWMKERKFQRTNLKWSKTIDRWRGRERL